MMFAMRIQGMLSSCSVVIIMIAMYNKTVMIVCPNSLCRYMPVEGTEMTAIEVRVGEFTLASG